MDSQRIQSMLQFYRDKLNLQLVLATPGKLDSLVDNVETILAVVRDGENAIVSDISHEIWWDYIKGFSCHLWKERC